MSAKPAKSKVRRIEPDHSGAGYVDKPYSKKDPRYERIKRLSSSFSSHSPIITGRYNPSPDRACTSCALKLETTYHPCSLQLPYFVAFPKTTPRRLVHPFSFKRLASSPRPSSPSPSVHAQHNNCDVLYQLIHLDSRRNANTRVGTHHPTSTTRDLRQCHFPTLSISYFRYLDTSIFAVPYAFPVSPILLIHSQEFARVTALEAAPNLSKKWSLMPSFNAYTSP